VSYWSATTEVGRVNVHYLNESHILLFLVQVFVLLGCARALGALCEEVKIPAIAGEILAGVMLGPTLLGRLAPAQQAWLFPAELIQSTMLETMSWLGVFFLLLSSGFHVDITHARKSGRKAALVGIVGVLVPIGIGYPIFVLFDPVHHGDAATTLTFALFLAVAGSITAISVVARVLGDLRLAKKEEGSLALSACAINDVFGWFLFTVVMSLATSQSIEPAAMIGRSLGLLAFVVLTVTLGSRLLGAAVRAVKRTSLEQPAATQTFVVSLGILLGAITQWFGIHAILGFFLAGAMVGSTSSISDQLRRSISDTTHAIFVPLFFATLGIKIDFIEGIELWTTLTFCAVAMGGKYLGAWFGARLGGLDQKTSVLMGLIFLPGGAMEIVVATLALELRLIGQTVFVAIVFAALLSSILAGPLIGIQARRMKLSDE
jgi:Kef-type K+ transport system membrane component KefB